MKHTPAPWTADKLQDRDTFNIFASGFNTAMCQVSVMENATRRVTGAEVAANADLIAAAPELLAALIDAADALAIHAPDSWVLIQARAAIAKAGAAL